MSEESAKAFMEKVKEDKEFQEKLKGVDSDEKLFAFAKAAGFDFTKEEWPAAFPNAQVEGELTDGDLAHVAGGTSIEELINAITLGGPGCGCCVHTKNETNEVVSNFQEYQ